MSVFTSAVLQGLNAVSSLDGLSIPVQSIDTAEVVGATPQVMQRILHKLSRAGIITVKRGPGGGFRITEEQLRTKRVKDVLEALGQPVFAPEGSRASDRIQQAFYDTCDISLAEFFSK